MQDRSGSGGRTPDMSGYQRNGGGKGISGRMVLGIAFLMAILVCYGMGYLGFVGVSPSTYNAFVEEVQTNYVKSADLEVIQGPTGPAGPTGSAGATGAAGAQGAQGYSITGASIDGSGHLILTTDNPSTPTIDAGYVGGGSGGGGGVVTGEVTVVLDTPNTTFYSGTTAVNQVFPVKVTNGSSSYKNVTFGIILQCTSTDGVANVVDDSPGGSCAGIVPSMTIGAVTMSKTFVPDSILADNYVVGSCAYDIHSGCRYIYLLWSSSTTIPLAPGQTTTVYANLNGLVTDFSYEIWQVSITSVVATDM